MPTFDGEIALVTGAGRGFGRAIAERLAKEGAKVALMARSGAQVDAAAEAIRAAGGVALAVTGNVTVPEDVDRCVRTAEQALGPISLLVNNAGIPGPFGPLWEVDPEEWWYAQEVHIRAPMLLLRRILPGMVERNHGRAVIISAIASQKVAPHMSAYCTGKIAQNRIVAQAAAELADSAVKLFAMDPGFVVTDLARETQQSADAQKWLPNMVQAITAMEALGCAEHGLARCAERCVDLLSGRYDALNGEYIEIGADLDARAAATYR